MILAAGPLIVEAAAELVEPTGIGGNMQERKNTPFGREVDDVLKALLLDVTPRSAIHRVGRLVVDPAPATGATILAWALKVSGSEFPSIVTVNSSVSGPASAGAITVSGST